MLEIEAPPQLCNSERTFGGNQIMYVMADELMEGESGTGGGTCAERS